MEAGQLLTPLASEIPAPPVFSKPLHSTLPLPYILGFYIHIFKMYFLKSTCFLSLINKVIFLKPLLITPQPPTLKVSFAANKGDWGKNVIKSRQIIKLKMGYS